MCSNQVSASVEWNEKFFYIFYYWPIFDRPIRAESFVSYTYWAGIQKVLWRSHFSTQLCWKMATPKLHWKTFILFGDICNGLASKQTNLAKEFLKLILQNLKHPNILKLVPYQIFLCVHIFYFSSLKLHSTRYMA